MPVTPEADKGGPRPTPTSTPTPTSGPRGGRSARLVMALVCVVVVAFVTGSPRTDRAGRVETGPEGEHDGLAIPTGVVNSWDGEDGLARPGATEDRGDGTGPTGRSSAPSASNRGSTTATVAPAPALVLGTRTDATPASRSAAPVGAAGSSATGSARPSAPAGQRAGANDPASPGAASTWTRTKTPIPTNDPARPTDPTAPTAPTASPPPAPLSQDPAPEPDLAPAPSTPADGGASSPPPPPPAEGPADGPGSPLPVGPPQPDPEPAADTVSQPRPDPPLERDQAGCPGLGLSAIGDVTGSPPVAVAAAGRFRAMAAAELGGAALVCAHPIETWRDDLLIQRLVANDQDAGTLVGGLDPNDPVLKFSPAEWTSLQFRNSGSSGHNFAGVPTGREQRGGVEIIRTTRGGLVMERSDSWGDAVVNGAWEVWMAHGGPTGDMGLPAGKPVADRSILGAHQDFARGVLLLPGISSDIDAEAQPAGRYQWQPISEAERNANPPPLGSIVEVAGTGTSYVLDRSGVRHWIVTQSDWGCAHTDLHLAASDTWRGYQLAWFPLGEPFVCPR